MALGDVIGGAGQGTLLNNPFAATAGVTLDPIQQAAQQLATRQALAGQLAGQAAGANYGTVGQQLGTPLADQYARLRSMLPGAPGGATSGGEAAVARSAFGPQSRAAASQLASPAAATGEVAGEAATATQAAKLGLLARRPFLGALPEGVTPAAGGMFSPGGAFGAGSIGRGGLYGLGGYAAGQLANTLIGDDGKGKTNADEIATGALTGAGMGAGLGSMIMPGVGTAVGAGLGLVGGGLVGWLGPKQTGDKAVRSELNSQTTKLNKVLDTYGASSDLREQALAQLTSASYAAKSKGDVKAVAEQIASSLPAAAEQDRQLAKQRQFQQSNNAAVQAWLQPMLQSVLDRQWYSAQQQQDMANSLAGQYKDPALAAAARSMAASIPADTAAQQAALLGQLSTTPALYGYSTGTNDKGMANTDLASVLMAVPNPSNPGYQAWVAAQQALQQANAGGGAGSTDLNAALQQLVGAGSGGGAG